MTKNDARVFRCEVMFGLQEWEAWLDARTRAVFGLSGAEFETSYHAGKLGKSGTASDIGSVIPLLIALRQRGMGRISR